MVEGLRLSTKEAAERLGLEQKEVIRRIRRGDIEAEKFPEGGWIWTIPESEIARIQKAPWYQRYLERHDGAVPAQT